MRLSGRSFLILGALVGLVLVVATDQIVPATSSYQAQVRVWLAARAAGVATYLLLAFQVLVGLVLSHPTNRTTWRLSRALFPWHEDLLVFVLAFAAVHIVSLVVDPYAGVGVAGAFVPGLSSYRSAPVALGTLGLYALLITGFTARYARMLPAGLWLKLHRLSLVVFVLAWLHGVLAGTDTMDLLPLYIASGSAVGLAAAHRYWVVERRRTGAAAGPAGRQPPTSVRPTARRPVTSANRSPGAADEGPAAARLSVRAPELFVSPELPEESVS